MLRITPTEKASSRGLRLEGRLEGPWVDVLRKSWTDASRGGNEPALFLDLGAVSFADSQGRALLLRMQQEGVGLIKTSAFLREMLRLGGPNLNENDATEKGA